MSYYADSRIREALKQAKGDRQKARQLIAAWAFRDPELLKALTQNHLSGIVAYHIERVISGKPPQGNILKNAKSSSQSAPSTMRDARKTVQIRADDKKGQELIKALSNQDAAIFGFEAYGGIPKNSKASQNHINAISMIATRRITKKKT